jgi:cryptochrome
VLEEPNQFPYAGNHKTVRDVEYPVPRKPTDLPWPRNISKDKATPLWNAEDCKNLTPIVHGGETLALKRLESTVTAQPTYVATFEKPKTSCTSLNPSTTVLSPYLSWGCLSPRVAWNAVHEAAQRSNKPTTLPPVSLKGQLLWRDFNHLMAHTAPGTWGQIKGNPHCRPIPWDNDKERLEAWKTGKTGYPWIDACMMQLKQEGWVHHLGRHAVACFLTRGDLWQSWEEGALHFESHLLDGDYALNGFNWLWLSCSGFFYQYFRCYSPIAFQKKNDPSGNFIRKYLPILKKLPDKYIYEPWTAPLAVQRTAGVIIGKDYPNPIVDHAKASKENMSRMKEAYDACKAEDEAFKGGLQDKKRSGDEQAGSKRKQRQS